MLYKTIVLGLIEDRKRLHGVLKARQEVLPLMEHYAKSLRERHLLWVEELQKSRPELDQVQLRQVAMELALAEYVSHFDLLENQAEAFDLDDAMASLNRASATE